MCSSRVSVLAALCAASLLIACGASDSGDDGDGSVPGPCDADPAPAECGADCDADNPCASGYYCGSDGTCTADCTASGGQCADGEECDGTGQCAGGDDDDGGDGDGNDGGDDEDCPAVEVNLTPVTPLVTLLIDQSGSMVDPFPGPSQSDPRRWDALRDALIGTNEDGVLYQLQSSLVMGAALYTSENGGPSCPVMESVPAVVNNADAIANLLDTEPVEDTPTAESVTAVAAAFPASDDPRIIVLATDGLPDTCDVPDPETQKGQNASEAAVAAAFEDGIQTFALSVGPDISQTHLQRLANAGQGIALDVLPPAAAPVYRALDTGELVDAFEEIIGGIARSCEIDVDSDVDPDRADEGTVVFNGEELEYGTDWEMLDENTLVLLGATCDAFLSADEVALSGEFPCGVVVDVD
ncbi:MAG TPA: vWA domain-containing protein [Kofleriaceae bacterium]|nr:vWA domain-containing protein [Kofleriaceae bacterium]